ncbi:S41 family peptidase [Candidatus Jidaibacter acanthamoebae]|nr:S41 family peptidase [Candidatus Jidaibacter acanthamoeba]
MKNSKTIKQFGRVVIFIIILFILVPVSFSKNQSAFNIFSSGKEDKSNLKFFKEVLDRVKKEYITEVDDKQLIENALDGMLSSLDPHSGFFDQKAYKEFKTITSGEFVGLGIEVMMENGFIKVISPYDGSPAEKAGLKTNDYITAIEGEVVRGMKLSEAVEKLKGAPNTKVNITVFRESTGQNLQMSITRKLVPLIPLKARIISEDVLYVKILNFNEKVSADLKSEVKKLIGMNGEIKGAVLDLRSNPGGLLDQACEVSDLFLNEGEIVTIKGRDPSKIKVYKALPGDIINNLPMVVLINAGTASAPEIVAGALQDNKRAIIVGEKSFGKGSVQSTIPFSNGTAIKLTTAKYYTPSGRSIQAEGIKPDIYIEEAVVKPVDKTNILYKSEQSLKGHLQNEHKINAAEKKDVRNNTKIELKIEEDFQLLRAVDLIKGMTIYNQLKRVNQ